MEENNTNLIDKITNLVKENLIPDKNSILHAEIEWMTSNSGATVDLTLLGALSIIFILVMIKLIGSQAKENTRKKLKSISKLLKSLFVGVLLSSIILVGVQYYNAKTTYKKISDSIINGNFKFEEESNKIIIFSKPTETSVGRQGKETITLNKVQKDIIFNLINKNEN